MKAEMVVDQSRYIEKPRYRMGKKLSSWKFCLECDRLLKKTEECPNCHPAQEEYRLEPE